MNYLALHGFTQRGSMWGEVGARAGGTWVCPDLPGHGGWPARPWEEAVAFVAGLLDELAGPRCLLGYSMGGRLALAAAVEHPGLVDRLVLVSTSPGIADAVGRARRLSDDRALADHLETAGVDAFLDEWLARPLFAGLAARGEAWCRADREARLGSEASGLAEALRLLGQGAQPYLGDRLGELPMPVLLVAGSGDEQYAALAWDMAEGMARAEVALVAGAGHAVVGEKPVEVAGLLASRAAAG
jgi:2-succinyl-6-hydroxy-2,4-cyclohexadiene-1-carboxylate synthase